MVDGNRRRNPCKVAQPRQSRRLVGWFRGSGDECHSGRQGLPTEPSLSSSDRRSGILCEGASAVGLAATEIRPSACFSCAGPIFVASQQSVRFSKKNSSPALVTVLPNVIATTRAARESLATDSLDSTSDSGKRTLARNNFFPKFLFQRRFRAPRAPRCCTCGPARGVCVSVIKTVAP